MLMTPFLIIIAIALFLYWFLVTTEGTFLGSRLVIYLYDLTAHKYDRIKEYTAEDQTMIVVEPLLAGIQVAQPKLLDVATGTGRVPYFLRLDGRFDGEIVALDGSRKMLDHAIANFETLPNQPYDITVEHRNAVPLPYPDSTYDAVTSLEALEFFPSDVEALAEMVRVLKPGGFLMTTRRIGWESRLFLNRYRSEDNFTKLLESLNLVHIAHFPWQNTYDLVIARKPY